MKELNQNIAHLLSQISTTNLGINFGTAGLTLAQFQLADTPYKKETVLKQFEQSLYNLDGDSISEFSLGNGVTGLIWLTSYLSKEGLEIEADYFEEIFEVYIQLLPKLHKMADKFDFLYGPLGWGLACLKHKENNTAHRFVSDLVSYLDQYKTTENSITSWYTIDQISEKTEINLGLAHGVPSVLSMLSKLYKAGIQPPKTKELIKIGIESILQLKNKNTSLSNFPNSSTSLIDNSRLAWCYGDLGIGMALLNASIAIGDDTLKLEAVNIFTHATQRRNLQKNYVADACFCHGTMGIAHIFNRVYQMTAIDLFQQTAQYWLNQGQQFIQVKDDGTIDLIVKKTDETKIDQDQTLMNGLIGISLVLSSFDKPNTMDWDECVMLS